MKFDNLDVEIRDVQKFQLEILLEFDRICKKNNIKYQLFAGTLLGAIRHKGFIPWDDDVDVCLLRKDYETFIRVCEKDLDNKYFLQTYDTDKNYFRQFARIRKNNTLFLQEKFSECEVHNGIFIDIFPLDNILPDTFIGEVQRRTLRVMRTISNIRIKKVCLITKSPLKRALKLLLHYVMKIIPISWTDRFETKVCCMFENRETRYISHLVTGAPKNVYMKYMMEKETFYETIDGEFEGNIFPIPKNYDAVLTRLFGNYMKPPPEDEQKPHHGIIEISFDTKSDKMKINF